MSTTPPPTTGKSPLPILDQMDASIDIQQEDQANPFEEDPHHEGADQSFYEDANPADFERMLHDLQNHVQNMNEKFDNVSSLVSSIVERIPTNILLPAEATTPSGRKSVSFHPDTVEPAVPKTSIGDRLGGKAPITPASHTSIKVNKPKPFSGQRSEAEDFVFQCQLNFDAMAVEPSERNKMTFFASYLASDALHWYRNVVIRNRQTFATYFDLLAVFLAHFGQDEIITEEVAIEKLAKLTQTGSCQTYSNQFTHFSSRTQHNEYTLKKMYLLGLKEPIRAHLNNGPEHPTLAALMRACILFDDRQFALQRRRSAPYDRSDKPSSSTRIASSQIRKKGPNGHAPLTAAEKKHRIDNHLCLYCGTADCVGVTSVKSCPLLMAKNVQSVKVDGATA
jgi:hypothetical protein